MKHPLTKPFLILLAAVLLALPAFAGADKQKPAGERLAFTNTNPEVLGLLASEGWVGGVQVGADLFLDGGKDVYRFKGKAECAGLVEVSWGEAVLEAQITSSIFENKSRWTVQAVSTQGLGTARELFAVRGGEAHRIEVAWTGGVDDGGMASTFTQSFERMVACDQIVAIRIDGQSKAAVSGDLFQGVPSDMPRREAGDSLLGRESKLMAIEKFESLESNQTCETDNFDDNNLDGWSFSFIGDADQGGATAVGGKAQVTSDGTTFYHVDDNGGFLYRPITGDFRAQIKLTGFPGLPTNGSFRKTSFTVRTGLGPNDPRVTVQFIPKHPTYNRSAMQFDYRGTDGVEYELASTPLGVAVPNYLMIERRGTVFSGYYSTDGVSWVRPLGGAGNAVSIAPLPNTLLIGMMNASYSATSTITAEFDDFKACKPNVIQLPPVPPHGVCAPGTPIDILYLLDSTGSMTFPFAEGGVTKLDAARQAIAEMNDLIQANLPGSRAALVTFQGGFTPAYNLNNAVNVLSGLTTDFDAVDAAASAIDVTAINPDATTPIAIALDATYELFQSQGDPNHVPVTIFIGDGWPNIDSRGYGPGYYRFEEMQAISIGAYLPPGQVAWLGNFNGPIDTYDGEVLANAMQETLRLKQDIPNFMMFTLGVQSNATFRADLLGFMALYTGADFYAVDSAEELIMVLAGIYNGLDCGADIGDRVWNDVNADGVQDAGEAGLAGWTVTLLDEDGNEVASTTTDANGNYLFEHQYPGTYTVVVTPAAGYETTYDYDGVITANQATVTVVDDQVFLDADFGYQLCAGSIGNTVWNDANNNGMQDVGEAGIAGVTVQLYDAANQLVTSAVTDAAGSYSFTGLSSGTYTVKVVAATLPTGVVTPTWDRDGVGTADQATVVLGCNQNVTDADFGYMSKLSGWCPRTIGYWKNHTEMWPVTSLTIGGVTYNQTQLLAHLNSNSSDASRLLIKQLVGTMLNLAMGSDPSTIQNTVNAANTFLVSFPPGSNPKGSNRAYALSLKDALDKYNNDPACH